MKRRFFLVMLCVLLAAATLVAPVSASASSNVQIMKVTVNGARLRTGPGVSAIQKPSLKKGEKVFYAGKQVNAFCYVCTTSGRKGYVYKNFLAPYGVVNSRQVYYTTGKTTLYKKASTKGGKKATLGKKQFVLVYETRGNWAYVKTTSGKGGFVKLTSLAKA